MKTILFVCVENSCRSQMAEGFAQFFDNNIIEAYSAGSNPGSGVNPKAIEVMKEVGIDLSSKHSKTFHELAIQEFDYVVSMGCQDVCPLVAGKKHIAWHIEDPKGKDIETFRGIRDSIKDHVHSLIQEIKEGKGGDSWNDILMTS